MLKELLTETERLMQKSVEVFEREIAGMRAGRAHPALLDKVQVDYYGQVMPLSHLANVGVPEPRTLTVQPYDKSGVSAIEKAIQKSDLGLGIRIDGDVIRLSVPALTEERRKDLVRQLKRITEEERVTIRHFRREAIEKLRQAVKDHAISEDDERRGQTDLQKLTDRFIKEVDGLESDREKDIMTP